MDDSNSKNTTSTPELKHVVLLSCNECHEAWVQRRPIPPKRCPRCQSRRWNRSNLPMGTATSPPPSALREFIQPGTLIIDKHKRQLTRYVEDVHKSLEWMLDFHDDLLEKLRYAQSLMRGAAQSIESPRFQFREKDQDLDKVPGYRALMRPALDTIRQCCFEQAEAITMAEDSRNKLAKAHAVQGDAVQMLENAVHDLGLGAAQTRAPQIAARATPEESEPTAPPEGDRTNSGEI